MATGSRRQRRPDSLASALVELLTEYEVPVPTHAVRIVLNARGRGVTAEHLGRVAAYERDAFERTFVPPRLCWAISPNAEAVAPRWWARAEWRLQRRILTDDVRVLWLATLAERWCYQLASSEIPMTEQTTTLAFGTATRLLGDRYFDVPTSPSAWMALRREIVEEHPGATHSLGGPTSGQREAEASLLEAGNAATDLYFGRRNDSHQPE